MTYVSIGQPSISAIKALKLERDPISYCDYLKIVSDQTSNGGSNIMFYYPNVIIKPLFAYNCQIFSQTDVFLANVQENPLMSIIDQAEITKNDNTMKSNMIKQFNIFHDRERNMLNYFVCYHATTTIWKYIYDITKLAHCMLNNKNISFLSRTFKLRSISMSDFFATIYPKCFEASKLLDHDPDFKNYGSSVNLSLYSGGKNAGENTIEYFLNGKCHATEEAGFNLLKKFMDWYFPQASDKIFQNFRDIYKKYLSQNSNGVLYQIFIDPTVVDKIMYISAPYGYLITTETSKFLTLYKNRDVKAIYEYVSKVKLPSNLAGYNLESSLEYYQGRIINDMKVFLDTDMVYMYELNSIDIKYDSELLKLVDYCLGLVQSDKPKACAIL
jgi:hypothetical protein